MTELEHVTPTNPATDGLNAVLARNIAELQARRRDQLKRAGLEARAAAAITAFVGSMPFAYLHVALVVVWVVVNLGLIPGATRFDPTFVGLATLTSVEGIFLTTFVLISQNRDAQVAEQRAELDLQINLLSEHEVTRLVSLARALAAYHGLEEAKEPGLSELERDVSPGAIAETLEAVTPPPAA